MLHRDEPIILSSRLDFCIEHGLALLLGVAGLLLHISALNNVATSIWPLALSIPLIGIGFVRLAIQWGREVRFKATPAHKAVWAAVKNSSEPLDLLNHFDDEGRR
jgi:hypothetical protein